MNPIPTIANHLFGNPYVGRGIIIGTSPSGKAVCAYFIMGRSENSRNRVFLDRDGIISTEPYDGRRVEDPSLIIYTAVKRFENKLIVTNGDHTDTIYDALALGDSFQSALCARTFEPDAPHYTPRIGGMVTFENDGFSYEMGILKSVDTQGSHCQRSFYTFPSRVGLGHFIHTYKCDGTPLPSFEGEPKEVVIYDDVDVFTDEIWNSLDTQNKISLYVRYTDPMTGSYESRLINKNG